MIVDSDLEVGTELDVVRIAVDVLDGAYIEREARLAETPLPVSLGVQAGADETASFFVTATALKAGAEVAKQTVRARFLEDESRVLPIALCASCGDLKCAGGDRCDRGTCVSQDVPTSSLPAFGAVSRLSCTSSLADAGNDVRGAPATSCETSGPGLTDCGLGFPDVRIDAFVDDFEKDDAASASALRSPRDVEHTWFSIVPLELV